jgi:hypothetical protein
MTEFEEFTDKSNNRETSMLLTLSPLLPSLRCSTSWAVSGTLLFEYLILSSKKSNLPRGKRRTFE